MSKSKSKLKSSVQKFYEDFGVSKNSSKQLKSELLYNLLKKPVKDKSTNAPHTYVPEKNAVHQADLLFLPNDHGYKYALVVTDLATRATDIAPLKTKDSGEVAKAFKTIYKRKVLDTPSVMQVDAGSEFAGEVKRYFDSEKTYLRVGKAGRHRQQAAVEAKNQIIGKALHLRMTAEELNTGETAREWVAVLPRLVEILNKRLIVKPMVEQDATGCNGDSCNMLDVGTKVRVMLDEPRELTTGQKLHGKFRSTDIRWESEPTEIEEVSLRPNQPPLYITKKYPTVGYTKNQLQIVPTKESKPSPVTQIKFIVEDILKQKKVKGKLYYLVKWYKYNETTWEPASTIREDVPDIVKAFSSRQRI